MMALRCFLGWRSYVRYEQSDNASLVGPGGTKSAISYLDVVDSYSNTHDGGSCGQRRSVKRIMNRYAPQDEGNKSTPALSYINTDQESSPLFAV